MDGTGKRRKLFRIAGVVSGVVIAGYAVALGVSLGTGADVPLTTWVVPEKKPPADEETKVRRKSAVPTLLPQPSMPYYYGPPVVTPSATVTPTDSPTKTAAARPTVVTKSPSPTKKPTETASPTTSATPTVTVEPPADNGQGNPPTAPPGLEKKTVEE